MKISVYGAGTLGGRIVARLPAGILAVTQSTTRHDRLRAAGGIPTVSWPAATGHVVLSLPGSATQLEGIERLSGDHPERAVLVSTTGYHAPYGPVVTAESPRGTGERAALAAKTERAFREWTGDRGVIVRLGGLYTAERGPAAAFARTGRARLAPGDAPLPLIHYDDAAELVCRALLDPMPPPVVLGVSEVVSRQSFYSTLAAHLGVEPPPFAPDGGPSSFDLSTREQLVPEVSFPDWRTALPARVG